MSGIGLHPLAPHEPQSFQPAEQRINRSLRYDQIGVALQPPQNLKPVEFPVPQGSQDGQLKTSFAELNFPLVSSLLIARAALLHLAPYNALQGIVLSNTITCS